MRNDFKLSLELLRELLGFTEKHQMVAPYKPDGVPNTEYIRRELVRMEEEHKIRKIKRGVNIYKE